MDIMRTNFVRILRTGSISAEEITAAGLEVFSWYKFFFNCWSIPGFEEIMVEKIEFFWRMGEKWLRNKAV
jgi:homospermidine synthase